MTGDEEGIIRVYEYNPNGAYMLSFSITVMLKCI